MAIVETRQNLSSFTHRTRWHKIPIEWVKSGELCFLVCSPWLPVQVIVMVVQVIVMVVHCLEFQHQENRNLRIAASSRPACAA